MNFIKNNLKKIGVGLMGLFGMISATAVKAAEDTDLTSALASSSAFLTDNKGAVLGWFATIFGFVILVVIVIGLLGRARRQVGGAVGGGRRRR